MWSVETPAPAPARPLTFREVTLPSGVRLQYAEQGPEDGDALLMLHGMPDSWFSYSRVLPLLPPHVRAIVPDQRGYGNSDRPLVGYDVDDFATDAIQLLETLGVRRAGVIGHSMGSFVARRVAQRMPVLVSRLVLIGSAPHCRNEVILDLERVVAGLTDPLDEAFLREFQTSTLHRPVPPDFLDRIIGESAKVPHRVLQATVAGLLAYEPSAQAIHCPVQILGGERDAVFAPAEQRRLAAAIPGATLHLVEDIGHDLHWEAPELFVELMAP